ncbi:hypothetical protein L861_23495 [Litchfieldella anticariensis FP35 = DSM 16096]|uniref:YfhG lipoprotein n=1 Tax=Litchfieldella anticariensis (strain DSM 16096 / CECT 5854 / CIP 108499 / LMG 22089 / FP35) TaxID=1121939 RepID=S2LDB1_LITA3|nr:hypothetical protein [Halomonas anticariensis]EPC02781.1 hypothetical protein L861_23495 [Halomonas anticariensis FP35 = DSM 16096]
MHYRIPMGLLAMVLLTGCQGFPPTPYTAGQEEGEETTCDEAIPTLKESHCLLDAWVDFGLASQRGDREWRESTLERLQREDSRSRLARAVALSWGTESQWDQAAEILRADLHTAPSDLQPLLSYWLNELEGRRAMGEKIAGSEAERQALAAENKELADKLEALTAIEQSINLRQQSP